MLENSHTCKRLKQCLHISILNRGEHEPLLEIYADNDMIQLYSKEDHRNQINIQEPTKITDIFAELDALCLKYDDVFPIVDIIPKWHASSFSEGVLLLWLTKHWTFVISKDYRCCHVVLSHAFPLSLEPTLCDFVMTNIYDLLVEEQLLILDANQFILVDPLAANSETTTAHHRRLLRASHDWSVIKNENVECVLGMWSDYCENRFGIIHSNRHKTLLSNLFSQSGFFVKEFWRGDACVARSLLYTGYRHRILYDILTPWSRDMARLRPGIFSAVHNLIESRSKGMQYSLCYGIFPYKEDIVHGLPRIDISPHFSFTSMEGHFDVYGK